MYRIDYFELINTNKIQFLYNAQKIKFGDKTTLIKFFKNESHPLILVIDRNNLLNIKSGGKINAIFQSVGGLRLNFTVNIGTTIDKLLKKFLYKIDHPELIGNNKILFLYNASPLKFGDQTPVEEYFRFNYNPKILIRCFETFLK